MNTLTEMLKAQADFNMLVRTGGPHVTRDERLRQYALALMMEASELMDWLPWKHWSVRSGNKKVLADVYRTIIRKEENNA